MVWKVGDIALWPDAETAEGGGAEAIVSGFKLDGSPVFVWIVPPLKESAKDGRVVRIPLQNL